MATTKNPKMETGHLAAAKALNLPVSTKHCIEICDSLRYKDVSYAKKFLEEVVGLKRAVPFRKYVMNTGHKKGMSTGRYPTKAASEILKLLKSVEANAHFKGLNTGSLKITKLIANRAPIPFGGGRHRTKTKRTHVEVEVKERGAAGKKKVAEPVAQKKKETVHAETAAKQDSPVHKPTPEHVHTKHDHKHDDHNHDHADDHKSHTSTPAKPAVKTKMAAEEPSSAELLRRAQQKAADLKQQEKQRKETEQVSNLYEELQKKGSLRSAGVRK
ncbi:MAG: 50S ribosomal protein L22 [Nanoarchaeota archaeon]|nr:50S ribosomal protein L22 [Nanoarchaeota archaeon]